VDYSPADLRKVVAFRTGSDDELTQVLGASTLRTVEEEEYFFRVIREARLRLVKDHLLFSPIRGPVVI
jgi:hypothetical protein